MFGWIRRGWAWTKDQGRYLIESPVRMAAFAGAFVIGGVSGAPVGDSVYDYMWRDADFCNDCHVHDYADEAWARSIHANVTTCHDCHLVPFMHYPVMAAGTVLDPPQSPEEVKKAHVPNVICEACHVAASTHELTGPMTEEVRKDVVKIDDSPLHRVHLDAESRDPGTYLGSDHGTGAHAEPEPLPEGHEPPATAEGHGEHGEEGGSVIHCMDCHGSGGNAEAHRFTAARSNCLECHGGIDVAVGRLTELRCRECHYTGFVGVPGSQTASLHTP
jgi:hypothetical protein